MKKIQFKPPLMLAICMGFLLYKYLLMLFPAVMTAHLMALFHLSGTGLGNLAASFSYGAVVFQLLAGPLVDRYGIVLPAIVALVIASCGVLLFALTGHIHVALLARILMGAGAAFATVVYLRCASLWFPKANAGLAGGLLTIGVMLGAFLAEAPLAIFIQHEGPTKALLMAAALGGVLCVISIIWLREPASTRYQPLGHLAQHLWHLVKQPNNWLLAAYSGLAFAPLAVFGGLWGVPFLEESHHLSQPIAASMISLCYVGFGVGGPLFGYLSDRRQKRSRYMVLGLIYSTFFLAAVVYLPLNQFWSGVAMFGFGLGTGSFMLGFTMGREMNSIVMAGSIVSLINSGDTLLSAVTEPVLGKLLDWHWLGVMRHGARVFSVGNYRHAFILLFAYLLVALFCVFLLKKRRAKEPGVVVNG